ncbi:MAG: type II secretion system minor pseudopilin GspK [Candidatus Binatia bacterium]
MKITGNQRGVALLVTLLVISLLTVIVIEFTHSTEVDGHLTRNSLASAQAGYLARSGLALAEMTLRIDAEAKAKRPPERLPVETLTDPWAQPFPPMPVGAGFGAAGFTIIDESSRFNVNALSLSGQTQGTKAIMRQELFQGILEAVGLDENLLYALVDWLDPGDDSDRESGAESPYYLGLRPPYVPRNGRLLSIEELTLVKGFEQLTWEQWTALRMMLTAMPNEDLRINVHTAPELLLTALFAKRDAESVARTIIESRVERPFADQRELNQLLDSYGLDYLKEIFTLRSDVFTIYATGSAGDLERHVAVTEELRRQQFPPRLTILNWREEALPVALTSAEASVGMTSPLP